MDSGKAQFQNVIDENFGAFSLPRNPQDRAVGPGDSIRIYVSIKKNQDSNVEFKKLILMTPTNIKISMLKRQIEKEFTDLFPKENTFICGKIEDEYGYSLSNSSYVYELLKNGDRVYAIPDGFNITDEGGEMHLTGDINELVFMLRSIQQNICSKLADCSFKLIDRPEEILATVIPLGFSHSRVIIHNVSVITNKILSTERLAFLEDRTNSLLFNLLITMLNYWISDLIPADNFLLSSTVDLLEILTKSAAFCLQFKSAFVINHLMNSSKLDFISAQTRSRIIKMISYLSKGEFKDFYNARPASRSNYLNKENKETRVFLNSIDKGANDDNYVPSFMTSLNNKAGAVNRLPAQDQVKTTSSVDYTTSARQVSFAKPQKIEEAGEYVTKVTMRDEGEGQRGARGGNYRNNYQKVTVTSTGPQEDQEVIKTRVTTYSKRSGGAEMNDNLVNEYVTILSPENSQDMLIFGVQNLAEIIDNVVMNIIESRESYLRCMNLIEIYLPTEYHPQQIRILEAINKYLSEERAIDGLAKKIIPRLLKAFSFQPSNFHNLLFSMIKNHLSVGRYKVDIPTIISMMSSPYVKLQELGVKILSIVSDPNMVEFQRYDQQFENHIKYLLEISLSRKQSYEFRNFALLTLANLALKDTLRPHILYNNGIETILFHLRNQENLEGQRVAAKALLNLSLSSRDTKLKIVTELADEISKLHKNELDTVIAGYLQSMLQKKTSTF